MEDGKPIMKERRIGSIQKLFYESIQNYCSQRRLSKVLMDENKIQGVIKIIDSYNKTVHELDRRKYQDWRDYVEKYIVVEKNGEKKLLFKENYCEIVPLCNWFEILWKHHVDANHCKSFKLRSLVEASGIYMPFFTAIILVQICKKCSKIDPKSTITHKLHKIKQTRANNEVSKNKTSVPYRRGYLQILNMTKIPDKQYRYILSYIDLQTRFIFLRPLEATSCLPINYVAEELLKIFLEYGGPVILHTDSRNYTKDIISQLKDFKILIGKPVAPSEYNCELIKKILKDWMVNNDNKWSVGIYHAQYAINTLFDAEMGKTPYQALLGVEPKTINYPDAPLNTVVIGEEFITEEILNENNSNSKENELKSSNYSKTTMRVYDNGTKKKPQKSINSDLNTEKTLEVDIFSEPILENQNDLFKTPFNIDNFDLMKRDYLTKLKTAIHSPIDNLLNIVPENVGRPFRFQSDVEEISLGNTIMDAPTCFEPPKVSTYENNKKSDDIETSDEINKLYSTPGPSTSGRVIFEEDDDIECCCVCKKIDDIDAVCFVCMNNMHKECGIKNNDNIYVCKLCDEGYPSSDDEFFSAV